MSKDQVRETEADQRRIESPLAAALFGEHADWLRRYVRRLAGNWSLPLSWLDPDDVVQDAFVQLLRHNWADPIRNPGAWLCVVVRNQVAKAAQQHHRFADGDPIAHIEEGTAGWSSVPLQASTAEILAARAVVDAIADLPGNQQVATYLSRVQGWPHADIAAFLGCSASAAGVHVHRGTRTVSVVARNNAVLMGDHNTVSVITSANRRRLSVRTARRRRVPRHSGLLTAVAAVAAWTGLFLISGAPWWEFLMPVIVPVGTILLLVVVLVPVSIVMDGVEAFTCWLRNRRSERRADQAARREADSGS